MRAPACSKSASEWNAPSPLPLSTRTSRPLLTRPAAASGVSATRRSPGETSLGTATFIEPPSWALGAIAKGRRPEKRTTFRTRGPTQSGAGPAGASARPPICRLGPGALSPLGGLGARSRRPIAILVDVGRQLHPEGRSARLVRCRVYPPAVRLDDRPADREPHTHSVGFRREERLEDPLRHPRREFG